MNSLAESIARIIVGVMLGGIFIVIFGWVMVIMELFHE